ncbi:MAG: hypothetical protein KF825_10590 [Ferruginibacter sp.]|nr:hypothetical protein [Ferruginibacter sp.]
MHLIKTMLILVLCTGINIMMLVVATVFDLLLSVISFPALTIVLFALAGLYSGIFCLGLEKELNEMKNKKAVILAMLIWTTIICALLFVIIAPLSGYGYNSALKTFAVAEIAAVFIFWRRKFYYEAGFSVKGKTIE